MKLKQTHIMLLLGFGVDAIIDPLETRNFISRAIEMANHAPITEKYNVGVIQT
jgi:3-methylcrotonyl-CoA carboxylase beta subunit